MSLFRKRFETGFRFKFKDRTGLCADYDLLLRPGYTAVVGPDRCRKQELLRQLVSHAERQRWETVFFSAPAFKPGDEEDPDAAVKARVDAILANAEDAANRKTPLVVAMDRPEGGASADMVAALKEAIDAMLIHAGLEPGGMSDPIYVVAATNDFAMARGTTIDIRTGKARVFGSYSDFLRCLRQPFDVRKT